MPASPYLGPEQRQLGANFRYLGTLRLGLGIVKGRHRLGYELVVIQDLAGNGL
jgi:hypothetical protein